MIITHNVVLTGLLPHRIAAPPLRYEDVHRLVKEWPDVDFVLNGGLHSFEECEKHLGRSDAEPEEHPVVGCMVGREGHKNPLFAELIPFFRQDGPRPHPQTGLEGYLDYCQRHAQKVTVRNEEREAQLAALKCAAPVEDEEGEKGEGAAAAAAAAAGAGGGGPKVKKRAIYSMGELIKPPTPLLLGLPHRPEGLQDKLEELLLRHSKAKDAVRQDHPFVERGGWGGEEEVEGAESRSQFVFDFAQLEKEESGELLVEIVEEAVKTIPRDFLDAAPVPECR